jgi:ribosomal protein S18 acetylase RimI-like enzyme
MVGWSGRDPLWMKHERRPMETDRSAPASVRMATTADEPALWAMLFYAANMADDGATSAAAAYEHPYLARYVRGWGRPTDLGVVAVAGDAHHTVLGAAWFRLLIGAERTVGYIDDQTPELAMAVHPTAQGRGIGTALLTRLLAAARGRYPAVSLNVRATNPAQRLYQRCGFVVVDTITNRVGGVSYNMVVRF